MASKHLKRYATLYVIREIQTKATMRYLYIPSTVAQIWKTDNAQCWWGCGNRNAGSLLVGMKMVQLL